MFHENLNDEIKGLRRYSLCAYGNGNKRKEAYYKDGLQIQISYDNRGDVSNISYYKEKTHILHREDGPAVIKYDLVYKPEEAHEVSYWIDGLLHRIDGPARIWYNDDVITACNYYMEGIEIPAERFLWHLDNNISIENSTEDELILRKLQIGE